MRFLILLCIATVVLARSKKDNKPVEVELIACKNMNASISCPHGYLISIESAMYGRLSRSICPYGSIGSTTCSLGNATQIAQSVCNNKRSCSLLAGTAQFPDPCLGIDKYLDVKYMCIECHECCENEVFRVNSSNCEPACIDSLKPDQCVVAPGCSCKPPLVRDTLISGKCVVKEYCPFFDQDFPTCRTNEAYDACGTNCTTTCQTDASEIACTKQCIPGFFCLKHYIKDEDDGRCIKVEDCPCC